jgi:pyruvate formate lyase activating enzyme
MKMDNSNKIDDALSRREFLCRTLCATGGFCVASAFGGNAFAAPLKDGPLKKLADPGERFVADARWWESFGEDGSVKCLLCPKKCRVSVGKRGACKVRENRGGKYKTLVHSRTVAKNVDPVEKKPLYHFLPSTKAFSIATAGCNIECKFCQNWQISQSFPEKLDSEYLSPEKVVSLAENKFKCPTIAYTYSEPTVFYEYMYDTAKLGKEKGIRSVMISNGFMNEKPLRELCKNLSAVKIDLKAFTEKFYKETCSGELKPVLNTLKVLKDIGIWFEIVVLIIPTLNDSEKENREMCRWIVKNLGPDVPIHYSQFHSTYKIRNLPRTPIKTLERCHDIAKEEGINYAYLGNVWTHKYASTFCPGCGKVLIKRQGYHTEIVGLKEGKCEKCGKIIPGVWK